MQTDQCSSGTVDEYVAAFSDKLTDFERIPLEPLLEQRNFITQLVK